MKLIFFSLFISLATPKLAIAINNMLSPACLINANMIMTGSPYQDPTSITIMPDGKINIPHDLQLIGKPSKDGNTETFRFKSNIGTGVKKNPKTGKNELISTELETVVSVTRDNNGRITKVVRSVPDIALEKFRQSTKGMSYPSQLTTEFSYGTDGTCNLNQAHVKSNSDEMSAVTYDRTLCEKVSAITTSMGTEAMNQCLDLHHKLFDAVAKRDAELRQEQKHILYFFSEESRRPFADVAILMGQCSGYPTAGGLGGMGMGGNIAPRKDRGSATNPIPATRGGQ